MNSKAEYEQGSVARIVIAHGLWEKEERKNVEEIRQREKKTKKKERERECYEEEEE